MGVGEVEGGERGVGAEVHTEGKGGWGAMMGDRRRCQEGGHCVYYTLHYTPNYAEYPVHV